MTSNICFGLFRPSQKPEPGPTSSRTTRRRTHSTTDAIRRAHAPTLDMPQVSRVIAQPVFIGDRFEPPLSPPQSPGPEAMPSLWDYIPWRFFSNPPSPESNPSSDESVPRQPVQTLAPEEQAALGKTWIRLIQNLRPAAGNPHSHYRRAHHREFAELKALLAKGVSVDQPDRHGRTGLMMAAGQGNLPLVEFLLLEGAKLQATDQDGLNALHAAASGAYQVAEGATNSHNRVAEYLIDQGISVHARSKRMQDTPMLTAARRGNLPLIRLLHGRDADTVRAENRGGNTPLHEAAGNHQLAAAQLLIDLGADKNAVNGEGNTPAHRAATVVDKDMLILLFKNKANLQLCNAAGQLPREMPNLYRNPGLAQSAFLYM